MLELTSRGSSRLGRVFLLVLAVLTTPASQRLRAATVPAPHSTLLVYVEDAAAPLAIPGATIRILSEDGAVLATATTDESGEALIVKPDRSLKPSLILAEHQAFYVGGTRWSSGADEICIRLAIWRTCSRTTVTFP